MDSPDRLSFQSGVKEWYHDEHPVRLSQVDSDGASTNGRQREAENEKLQLSEAATIDETNHNGKKAAYRTLSKNTVGGSF